MALVVSASAPRAGRVLVTGAGGFIGRALCDRLAAAAIDHVGAVRQLAADDAGRRAFVPLGDFAAADWAPIMPRVDTIVHLAGRAHVGNFREASEPTPFVVANVHVTRRLLDAARAAGVRRFVLASTIKVYGEATPRGRPFRAGDPAKPEDAYAHSKLGAESLLWQAVRNGAIEGVVLRLPLTYGPGVKGNFLLLLDVIAAGRSLPLGGIANARTLLYVGNAVSAIEAAIASPALAGETLPVADAESVSTSALIERLARELAVPPRLYRIPLPLLRAAAMLAGRRAMLKRLVDSLEVDAGRFCDRARWTPPFTLEQGLHATAAWWKLRHSL
ncbi:MAG TPA: NAD-dependent epimerase/dehydratase family protein [Casimicrobiaceae bacterium]|nr:NAD-dependent epimerase/dehydratase family protein [Casimicrobiaceae bacterium]